MHRHDPFPCSGIRGGPKADAAGAATASGIPANLLLRRDAIRSSSEKV